jgi:acyl carrier protein
MTAGDVKILVFEVVAQVSGEIPHIDDALQGGRLALDSLDFAEIVAIVDNRLNVDGLENLRARTIGELAEHYVSLATG